MSVFFKKRTVRFYRLLITYILILVLLLAVVYPTVMSAYLRYAKTTIEESSKTQLANAAQLMDQRFQELNMLSNRISSNSKLRNSTLRSNTLAQLDAIAELKNYLIINTFISDIVLYSLGDIPSEHMVITASNKYSQSSFFKIFHFSDWSQEQLEVWKEYPRSLDALSIQLVNNFEKQPGGQEYVFLSYALPANSIDPDGILSFWIPTENVQTIAKMALGNQKGCFILRHEGEVYQYTNDLAEHQMDDEDAFTYTISSKNMLIEYEIRIPQSQMAAELRSARNLVSLVIVLLLVAGIGLSILLADYQYRAIRKVANKLAGSEGKDELKHISDSVDSILKNNQELSEQLAHQNRLLQTDRVIATLLGTEEYSDIFPEGLTGVCGVILLTVDDIDKWKKAYSTHERSLICASICEILEEVAQEYGNGYAVSMPDGASCAILMDASNPHTLNAMGEPLQRTFQKYYRFSATIGISDVSDDPTTAHARYLEASAAIQQRLILGGNRVIHYDQLRGNTQTALCYTPEKERTLISCIRHGNKDEACEVIQSVLNDQRAGNASAEEMMLTVIALLNSLLHTQKDLQSTIPLQQKQMIRMLRSGQAITYDQTLEWLCHLAETLCEESKKENLDSRSLRLNHILELVNARYCDPSFCLNDVAQALNLSSSYTTVLFKEATGDTLMSYVDALRMRHAIVLLETTQLPLREIVAQVGYTDQTNFIRKFKAIKGITPAVYRQTLSECKK